MNDTEWFHGLTTCQAKEDRQRLRPLSIVLAVMCILGLVYAAKEAYGAPMFKSDDGSVALKLLDTKCSDAKVLAFIAERVQPQYLGKFKDAVLTYGGKQWKSCWIEHQGHIFSIDEEGSPMQPIPVAYFHENTI